MKWNEKFEKRMIDLMLKAYGINPMGKHFMLAPNGPSSVDLVCGETATVMGNYTLEKGETIEELAECLRPLLEGGHVMAPTAM